MNKKILYSVAGLGALVTPLAIVACSSDTTTPSTDSQKVSLSYESSWKPVIDNAIKTLTQEDQDKIELVELKNGGTVGYLDTIANKPSDAADLFAAPADRYPSLIASNTVQKLTNVPEFSTNFGELNGEKYAYTLNVESVIQLFDKTKLSNDKGWDTFENAIAANTNDEKNFITQYNNMWQASSVLITAFKNAGATLDPQEYSNGTSAFIKQNSDNSVTAPFLDQDNISTKIKTTIDKLWSYNNKLRNSGSDTYQNFANNAQGSSRDTIIRAGLADGTIASTVDGPWIINDLVARVLLNNKDNKANAVKILENLSTSTLPSVGGKTASHFKSGWGYSINRAKLAQLGSNTSAINEKLALENRILTAITAKERATDWFQNAGKISATTGASVSVTDDSISSLKLSDPTNPDGTPINLSEWVGTTGFTSALSKLYNSVVNSVTNQSKQNEPVPTISNFNQYYDAWDKNGLSAAAITTSESFYTKFKTTIDNYNKDNPIA